VTGVDLNPVIVHEAGAGLSCVDLQVEVEASGGPRA
jgi:hypothetical protein